MTNNLTFNAIWSVMLASLYLNNEKLYSLSLCLLFMFLVLFLLILLFAQWKSKKPNENNGKFLKLLFKSNFVFDISIEYLTVNDIIQLSLVNKLFYNHLSSSYSKIYALNILKNMSLNQTLYVKNKFGSFLMIFYFL